jgi:ABC-type branched-subunit amino acid transport system ATPase component
VKAPAENGVGTEQGDLVRPEGLEVRGLSVSFGGVTAVDNVSLTVAPGEIVGLIGPNGAGKSTLIDAMCGFVRPSAGRIFLGGVELTHEPTHRRVHAGLVRSWQSLEIFEDLNVLENLQGGGEEVGAAQATWRERVTGLFRPSRRSFTTAGEAAVDAFGLAADLDRPPAELSFSQRRLVTTARAAALNPRVLLLDEPAAGMSDGRRRGLAKVLRSLAKDLGLGLLVVDHDMPFVMGLCDRIIALNFGAKIAEGSPAEVQANRDVIAAYLRGDASQEGPEAVHRPGVAAQVRRQARNDGDVLLAARNVAVGYYGRPVVRDIALDLHSGEVIALLGANRAGKTTTLLGLAGATRPLKGEVYWLGERVVTAVPLNRLAEQGMAFLTEERSVFRQLTVAENLRVGRCNVDEALDMFPELRPIRKRKVGLLSGGEQQMVGLSRALVRHPKVLLVDEMTLGLAPIMVNRLMEALRRAADEHDVGVILVEQHVPQALGIADHVCVLAGGRMTLSGSVAEVGHRVEEAFLEDVLGATSPP